MAPFLNQVFPQLYCSMGPLDSFQSSLHPWVLSVCLDCIYSCAYMAELIWSDTLATTQSVTGKTWSSGCHTPDLLKHNMHFTKICRWSVCTFQFYYSPARTFNSNYTTCFINPSFPHLCFCFYSLICNVLSFPQNMDKSYPAQVSTVSTEFSLKLKSILILMFSNL